jgi:predicted DNA binding CopG/RHH family protein
MTEIKKEPTGSMPPMPPFQTLEEEAEYWDTHSPVDELDEHTVVAVHRGQKTETLTVRFDPQDLAKLREQADERGMGPTTLVRMWVLEHLRGHHPG